MDKVDSIQGPQEFQIMAAKMSNKEAGGLMGASGKHVLSEKGAGDVILNIAEESARNKITSNHDFDTGLLNRRGLLEEYELSKATRKRIEAKMTPEQITENKDDIVLCLDLIGLKSINDKYGGNEGDRVIKNSAQYLKYSVRETDLVCRWGGDEFLIVLVGANEEDAQKVISKINAGLPVKSRFNIGFRSLDQDDNYQVIFNKVMDKVDVIKHLGATDKNGRSIGNGVVAKITGNWDIEKVS